MGPELEFIWNMLVGLPGLAGAGAGSIFSLSRAARNELNPSMDLGSSAAGSSFLGSAFSGSFAAKGLKELENGAGEEADSVSSGSFALKGLKAPGVFAAVACDLSEGVSCLTEPNDLKGAEVDAV